MTNTHAQPRYDGAAALLEAIERDDVSVLGEAIIAAALYEEDFDVVHQAAVCLSTHADEVLRGNAILAFGHLARLFERKGTETVEIVRRGLRDPSEYVRGQAWAAASDLRFFLGAPIDPEAESASRPPGD